MQLRPLPRSSAPLLDRGRAARGVVDHAGARWTVDTLLEPGAHDEDRLAVFDPGGGGSIAFVVADGAGNSGRGRAAAEHVVQAREPRDPVARLRALDGDLARLGAEAAVVVGRLSLGDGRFDGAACGDVRLWIRQRGEWSLATEGVARKPLLGAGASPRAILARGVDALLCASDGLAAWNGPELAPEILAHDDRVFRLVDAVRMRSGALADDVSIVWMGRETG